MQDLLTFRMHFVRKLSGKLARKAASSRLRPLSMYVCSRLGASSRIFSGGELSIPVTLDGFLEDIVGFAIRIFEGFCGIEKRGLLGFIC
jgi:hypothetical protein